MVLPALQRGAVWRAHQVEEIWNSLLRGFPIGSFLFTPVREITTSPAADPEYAYYEDPCLEPVGSPTTLECNFAWLSKYLAKRGS